MSAWRDTMSIGVLVLLLGAGTAATAAESSFSGSEVLTDGSELSIGCMGPCACPVLMRGPMIGGFRISEVDPDPLYRHFVITHVDWKVEETPWHPAMRFVGSGTYRVGGEVAVQQQLVLDLSIDGDVPRHFDSGLVQGGGGFPALSIDVMLHAPACYDTAIHVAAKPATAGVEDDGRTVMLTISPNPFLGTAVLRFVTATPGRVDAGVYDLSGRRVHALADGVVLDAGPHELHWDGVGDSGGRLASGLYFVKVQAGGRESRRTIVLMR